MRRTSLIFFTTIFTITGQSQENYLMYSASVTVDNVNNLHGGKNRACTFLGLMDLDITLQPDRSIFRNTSFYIHFLKTAGRPASEKFIGDAQVASNIEGRTSLFFYEIWIKQKLGNLSLLSGMHDMNSVFLASEHAGTFINSSFGISPAILLNMPVSIYPVTTLGTVVSYEKEQFAFLSGVYNLNHKFADEESFHTHDHIFETGFLSLVEWQYRRINSGVVKGEYKIGWFFKQCYEEGHGNDGICISKKNYGAYLIVDQVLYASSNNEKNINVFLQINTNSPKFSYASEYLGSGITLNGFMSRKRTDVIGFALARVKLNELHPDHYFIPGPHETVLELTCQQVIYNNLILQPDIQYIFNPGGVLPDAIVGIVRLNCVLF